jgi:hypothetical protein
MQRENLYGISAVARNIDLRVQVLQRVDTYYIINLTGLIFVAAKSECPTSAK